MFKSTNSHFLKSLSKGPMPSLHLHQQYKTTSTPLKLSILSHLENAHPQLYLFGVVYLVLATYPSFSKSTSHWFDCMAYLVGATRGLSGECNATRVSSLGGRCPKAGPWLCMWGIWWCGVCVWWVMLCPVLYKAPINHAQVLAEALAPSSRVKSCSVSLFKNAYTRAL